MRRIRIKKGISKNELCNQTGFNKGYVYRLENDLVSPTLLTLERVARAIDERLSDIIVMAEAEQTVQVYKKVSSAEDWGRAADSPLP